MKKLSVISFSNSFHSEIFKDLLPTLSDMGYCAQHTQIDFQKTSLPDLIGPSINLFVLDPHGVTDKIESFIQAQCSTQPTGINIGLLTTPPLTLLPNFFHFLHDVIFWPCSVKEIDTRINRFNYGMRTLKDCDQKLLAEFSALNLVGSSKSFLTTIDLIKKVARCHAPVLIQGETGTGKENAARSIHYLSNRREHGFIPINCAAIPDELFESELFGHEKGAFTDAKNTQAGLISIAEGGTLFLDEVDSLTPKAQGALLRFLQTLEYRPLGARTMKRADVRVLAATNADLVERVAQKSFREDLYFRLNVLNVRMPPLRERADDIPVIAKALLQKFSQEYLSPGKQLSANLLAYLTQLPWPGNVRELENALLRTFLLSPEAVLTQLADQRSEYAHQTVLSNTELINPINPELSFQDAKAEVINQFEENYLKQLLSLTDGNVSAAARMAGKERRALGKLIRKYRIDKSHYQSAHAF